MFGRSDWVAALVGAAWLASGCGRVENHRTPIELGLSGPGNLSCSREGGQNVGVVELLEYRGPPATTLGEAVCERCLRPADAGEGECVVRARACRCTSSTDLPALRAAFDQIEFENVPPSTQFCVRSATYLVPASEAGATCAACRGLPPPSAVSVCAISSSPGSAGTSGTPVTVDRFYCTGESLLVCERFKQYCDFLSTDTRELCATILALPMCTRPSPPSACLACQRDAGTTTDVGTAQELCAAAYAAVNCQELSAEACAPR